MTTTTVHLLRHGEVFGNASTLFVLQSTQTQTNLSIFSRSKSFSNGFARSRLSPWATRCASAKRSR